MMPAEEVRLAQEALSRAMSEVARAEAQVTLLREDMAELQSRIERQEKFLADARQKEQEAKAALAHAMAPPETARSYED
jgi:uncharacterized protein YlxW (UPF0749 family)